MEVDMNINDFDSKKLNGLFGAVSKKIGIPQEQLKKEFEEGRFDSAISAMNKSDAAKFNKVVNDPKMIERLMSTPQAQALYKKLSGK